MKIAVWKTGHEIADTVAEAVYEGLRLHADVSVHSTQTENRSLDYEDILHIGYGILRGMSEVFHNGTNLKQRWICIDRGYFKPNHYDGYYRISLCGTQQTFGLDGLEPDYERWDKLKLGITNKPEDFGNVLVCPPTDYVCDFFSANKWRNPGYKLWREKGCPRSLQSDLDNAEEVYTFNSSVGWEALRQGIPVVSDPQHSIVGAYQKMVDKNINTDFNERRKLFALMAGLQLSLDEIRQGMLWPLLLKLLKLST